MIAEVTARVKGKEVTFTFDYKNTAQAREVIAEKTGVNTSQVSNVKYKPL